MLHHFTGEPCAEKRSGGCCVLVPSLHCYTAPWLQHLYTKPSPWRAQKSTCALEKGPCTRSTWSR